MKIKQPLLASLLLGLSGAAVAVPPGEDGLTLGAQLGVINDDNPRQLADESEPRADRIVYSAANVGWSGSYSLQKFGVAVGAKDVRYDKQGALNYRSYNQSVFWNWALADRLSGRLAYARDRTPVALKYWSGNEVDLLTASRPEATVAWALTPDWYVDARYQPTENTHSLAERRYLDNRSRDQRYRIGMKSPGGFGGGLLWRDNQLEYTRHDQAPAGSQLDTGFRDRETSLYASWALSERTRFGGKLGYLSRKYDHAVAFTSERDFSGGIGSLDASYGLSGDAELTLNLARQVGGEEESVFGTYAVHRIVGAGLQWRMTPLLRASASLRQDRIDYQGGIGRSDRERTASVGLAYQPHRLVDIGLNYQIDRRTSNISLGAFTQRQISLFAALNY